MPALPSSSCLACTAPVVRARDIDTGEVLVVDVAQVDEGHVSLYALKGHVYARRYGQAARLQPAWREHVCPGSPPAPVADPYEDVPPAVQQHGGWRS